MRAILRWDAEGFFANPEIIEAVVDKGVVSPTELMRMASWPHEPDELAPLVTEVTEEAVRARAAITPRIRSGDVFWDDFRRRCPDLPEVRWRWVWEHVYDSIASERAAVAEAEAEARRRAAPPKSAIERAADEMNDGLSNVQRQQAYMARVPIPRPQTD
jgi:hypothetical protein